MPAGGAALTESPVRSARAYRKLHKAWNRSGMTTKLGTLYKWEEPKATTPTARGSGNCDAVFSNLLGRDGETHS